MGKSANKDAVHRRQCCCRVCSCIALVLGVLFVLFGIWSMHLKARFTPVYTAITCDMGPVQVKDVDWANLFSGFSFTIVSTTTCENPNPYTLTMRSTKSGQVYMGRDRSPVGTIEKIPDSTLPAHGRGTITAFAKITPTADTILTGIGMLFTRETQIYLESRMAVMVDINLLASSFKTEQAFNRDCGFNMRLPSPGSTEVRLGPMACGESFDTLSLPPVSREAQGEQLHLGGPELAGAKLEEAARLRDTSLGVCIIVGFSLGALLLLCGGVGLCLQLRRARGGKAQEQGGREADVEKQTNSESPPEAQPSLPRVLGGQSAAAAAEGKATKVAAPECEAQDEELGV